MSESNKTELPTPKRLEKAREEGNFLFSDSIVQWATTLGGVGMCFLALVDLPQRFDRGLASAIQFGQMTHFPSAVQNFLVVLFREVLPPTAMVMGAVVLFSIASNIAQVGFVFQGAKIKKGITFEQGLNVVANVKNLFSKHTLGNVFVQIIKTSMVCWIAYQLIHNDKMLVDRFYSHRLDLIGGLWETANLLGSLFIRILIALIPVIAFDYWLKSRFYQKDNMMSHDEVRKENKETEGDPEIKSHRKAEGRRILEEVERLPNASAVIRNPTHIAVAVRYEPTKMPIPYVVEMESEEKALLLIEEAKRLGIPLYEDIPLARGIFAYGAVDEHIPVEFAEQTVRFTHWLRKNHPDRIFDRGEFVDILTRIGDVKR